MTSSNKQKVLVVSHGHPEYSTGGAELAAYNLFNALKKHTRIESVTFLAGSQSNSISPGSIMMLRENEYLWRQVEMDWFRLRSGAPTSITSTFRDFLRSIKPDIVFVHHFAHLGIELFREIKTTCPQSRLVLTFHEFVAICNRNGQMVKTQSKKLCYSESIQACNVCFPEFSQEDFWLRKHFIQRSMENVDRFISPSQFLLDRYISWGVPKEFSYVIENGQRPKRSPNAPLLRSVPLQKRSTDYSNRFGYFGQATEYKGIDIFLEGIYHIPKNLRQSMLFEIHCANLDHQGDWFKKRLAELSTPLREEGTLRWVGSYDQHELSERMGNVGWIVVPSIWWENSPMVIQEAFTNSRPVICSNIGGMAEKVGDRFNGLHFSARNPIDLAEKIITAASEPGLWSALCANIEPTMSMERYAEEYMRVANS